MKVPMFAALLKREIRAHQRKEKNLAASLAHVGPDLIRQLCGPSSPHSLRAVARWTGLSPTYLSLVQRRKAVISQGAFVLLVEMMEESP